MGCQSSKSSAEREPTDEPPIVKGDIPSTSAKMEARIASKSLESTKNTPQGADQATNQDDITLSAEAEGKQIKSPKSLHANIFALPGLVRASKRGNNDATTFLQQFTLPEQSLWLPSNDSSFDFWTENHTFILLTTAAYMCSSTATGTGTTATPITLLRNWLNGHCYLDPTTQQNQYFIFELNSPPYTSHTVECLYLLVDYPIDGALDLQGIAQNILLQVIKQIMSVSLCNKSWLSAAVRMYPQNRLPTTTEPLIFHTEIFDWIHNTLPSPLENGQDLDTWATGSELKPSYLDYALTHTTYTLDPTLLPQPGQLVSLFGSPDPGRIKFEEMPFNWAAGLYFHYDEDSNKYVNQHHLNDKKSKFYNKHLASYSNPIEGKAIGAAVGHANHYCGIPSLSVWKSQGATVCLSCLPGFNVNDLQTDQLTCLANVMGIGIWTESGPAKILGFHITNEKGPHVNVSCQSPTTGTLTANYSIESDLYWPEFFFAHTVLKSSFLYGVTSAYTVENGISTAITVPDSSTLYWYVLVKVTSSAKGLKTAPRGDDSAGGSAPTFQPYTTAGATTWTISVEELHCTEADKVTAWVNWTASD